MRNVLVLRRIIVIAMAVFVLASCGEKTDFTIEGNIADAKDKTMYFEHIGVSKITVLDSVKLKDGGKFKLHHKRPDAPDFYRLRLDGHLINLAVDSTETITIQANDADFAKGYTVEGSRNCEVIKELSLLQLQTSESYNQLQQSVNGGKISQEEYVEQSLAVFNNYKDVAKKYIFQDPKSSAAYFALFQQVNNLLIFDPYDKDDYKTYGAVATAWNQYYAGSLRSKHIYNLALQALKVIRGKRPVEYDVTNAVDYFDVELPGLNGTKLKLSESCKGKVTLLDFTAYRIQESPAHNMALAEIYEKLKSQGFEIYQVSLDNDEHFWKNAASNLPWICVHDPESIYSQVAAVYNVKELPTSFLLNRSGEIVSRLDSYATLESEIKKQL